MKIKLSNSKYHGVEYSRTENVEAAVPVLSKYFDKIVAHVYVTSSYMSSNTAYFYSCRTLLPLGVEQIKITSPVTAAKMEQDSFFDWTGDAVDVMSLAARFGVSKTNNIKQILVNNQHAGAVIVGANILIASDWTHSRNSMQTIELVMEKLVEMKLLKPIKKRAKPTKLNITLGCDPEFEQLAGTSGYSVVEPTVSSSTSAEIGRDGSGSQIEIRPEASDDPVVIVNRIKNLIAQLPPVGILGNRFPLGGHIHIGGISPSPEMMTLLNDFLGKLSTDTSGTARGSYGRLGTYETKSYGFEYRSPASTWLHNPDIARITFKLVKNLVESAYSDGIDYEYDSMGIPTLASYEKLLTTDEAVEFIGFHKNYVQESKPINYNWGVEPVIEHASRLTFRDDWNGATRAMFHNAFAELSCEYPIYFYGLRGDRGDVIANFHVEGFESINHHPHPSSEGFWFGVPANIRLELASTDSYMREFIAKSVESITDILRHNLYRAEPAPVGLEAPIPENATTSRSPYDEFNAELVRSYLEASRIDVVASRIDQGTVVNVLSRAGVRTREEEVAPARRLINPITEEVTDDTVVEADREF